MSYLREYVLVLLLLAIALVKTSLACGGYGLTVKRIENCVHDGVIKVGQGTFTVELDKRCNVIPRGCFEISRDFNEFELKFTLDKRPWSDVTGVVDICALTKRRSLITRWLGMMGVPVQCPVASMQKCYNGEQKINIRFLKLLLSMAVGPLKLKMEGKHDGDGVSCIEVEAEVSGPA